MAGSLLVTRAPDADAPSVVTVYSREPIKELVAYGGLFVMNTEPEIASACRDFRDGKFGDIPRLARLQYR